MAIAATGGGGAGVCREAGGLILLRVLTTFHAHYIRIRSRFRGFLFLGPRHDHGLCVYMYNNNNIIVIYMYLIIVLYYDIMFYTSALFELKGP